MDKIEKYIKKSMCIEGTVDFVKTQQSVVTDQNGCTKIVHGNIYECNDKSRGQFFVGWFVEPDV